MTVVTFFIGEKTAYLRAGHSPTVNVSPREADSDQLSPPNRETIVRCYRC